MLSFLVAFLGLGFLILIHELGHFLVARKVGMKVEAFGIGFGKPIFTFTCRNVPIKICPIPFGGYVKIAGMESDKKGGNETVADGFFSKSPWARMAVALSGPLFNLLFALAAFSFIWAWGGREKTYSEVTARIGFVDPTSELYKQGVRTGDRVVSYNGRLFSGVKDHLYAAMTAGPKLDIKLEKGGIGGTKRAQEEVSVVPYPDPRALDKEILTGGVLASASYIIWSPPVDGGQMPLYEALRASGMQEGDRIIWVEGEPVFSSKQLNSIINDAQVYLTVLRDGHYLHVRVPRVQFAETLMPKDVVEEVSDWHYEASLQATPISQLWFIPYNISSDCKVQAPLSLLETPTQKLPDGLDLNKTLLPNDQIVAVCGEKVHTAVEFLKAMQEKKALVIVERERNPHVAISLEAADDAFMRPFLSKEYLAITDSIGTPSELPTADSLVLLKPIPLKNREMLEKLLGEPKNAESTKPSEPDTSLYLGLFGIQDRTVLFNPGPFTLCKTIGEEIYQTGRSLIGGYMSPRWMSGPVGIIQVIQQQMMLGWMEVLFWLGAISLNLAVLNLLPLPVLDGGYVLLSLFEMVTRCRVRAQTVEKIVLPFAVAFIAFILYLTYHDIMRIAAQFFKKWGLF